MPSNESLRKYEDKYFVDGIGRVSFSIQHHDFIALARISEKQIDGPVKKSAGGLVYQARSRAPYRTGALISGIKPSDKAERSATPGKVVYDVYMDEKMNDTFVKITKSGKRYYYPASQEYGFRIGRTRKKPGLYYMRDTAIEYASEHLQAVSEAVDEILEEL